MSSLALTHRDAETANVSFETSHVRNAGPRFVLIPVGLVHGHPERAMTTPKIHFESRSGGYLGKHMQAPSISAGARRSGSSGSRPRGPRGNAGAVATSVSAVHAGQKRQLPPQAAASFAPGGVQRVKRQTIAPSRISAGGGETNVKLELKEAKRLLKDLLGHKSAWPFAKPVDITKFQDYYHAIKQPMDLGTMKKKLEGGHYGDLDTFAHDLRIIWQNCYTYNKDLNSDVCVMAQELESIAEDGLARIPQMIEEKRTEVKEKQSNDMQSMQRQFKQQQKQLVEMQQLLLQQQAAMLSGGPAAPMPGMPGMAMPPMPAAGGGGGGRKSAGGGGGGGARGRGRASGGGGGGGGYRAGGSTAMVAVDNAMVAAPPQPQDRGVMSFELKAEISAGVAKLNGANISKVVDIIRQTMPGLGHDKEEIEIDVNTLADVTLWKLYDFIKLCQATKSKAGRPKKGNDPGYRKNMEDAARQTEQSLQNVRAARGALGGGDSSGGGGMGGGADDDWIDEGDSDGGFDGGGVSSGIFDNFQSARQQQEQQRMSQQQRERQQQDQMRQEQANAKRSAADRAAAAQRERDAQRQAERERRERERQGGHDMLGQSNMMASFETGGGDDDDEFIFDEYAAGGF